MTPDQMTAEQVLEALAELEAQRAELEHTEEGLKAEKRRVCRMLDDLRAEAAVREEVAKIAQRTGRKLTIVPAGIPSGEAVGTPGA